MTNWFETAHAAALLDTITADDLYPRWEQAASDSSEDRWHLYGPVKRMLQALLDAHVTVMAGATLEEAERRGQCGAWFALHISQPSVEQVLNERFGNPNTAGLPMPIRAGSWAGQEAATKIWRDQFPLHGNALRARAAREWEALDPALIVMERRMEIEAGRGED